jgi:hypothetical protein
VEFGQSTPETHAGNKITERLNFPLSKFPNAQMESRDQDRDRTIRNFEPVYVFYPGVRSSVYKVGRYICTYRPGLHYPPVSPSKSSRPNSRPTGLETQTPLTPTATDRVVRDGG